MIADGEPSLEHIQTSELYPKKTLVADDEGLQVPFPVLPGESVEFLGRTSDGIVALSNFRLFIRFRESFVNIPLGLIETIEYREIFYIYIYCKDAHSFRCTFATNETCLEWYKRLSRVLVAVSKLQEVFAFAFTAWCARDTGCASLADLGPTHRLSKQESVVGYTFGREVERLGFDLKSAWRIAHINEDFNVCASYGKEHIVPTRISDSDLESVAGFRACGRFPSVVWRDSRSGAVIARSSQPEVGWLGWRNKTDERLLQSIWAACAINGGKDTPKEQEKMLIVDCRSYAAAVANRAKGGGCECQEYYPNCEIQFMSLANIHAVRKSFQGVRSLCAVAPDQLGWLSGVEKTLWLQHLSGVMKAAVLVVKAIDQERRPVLVHCSDGWDRTAQISALAQLLLDPYYRTVEGFRVLVEREWLEFGHKFADRCGQGHCLDDPNERCPIFLQWLDCIHQMVLQFPCAFQFNQAFLVKLVQHTYSCLFGTFLCNTARERETETVGQQTTSVWSLLSPWNKKFINLLYKASSEQVLRPSCNVRHLQLWRQVYLSDTAPAAVVEEPPQQETPPLATQAGLDGADPASTSTTSSSAATAAAAAGTSGTDIPLLPKTRSCDDLVSAVEHAIADTTTGGAGTQPLLARRLSDPNIATDPNMLLLSDTESAAADAQGDDAKLLQTTPGCHGNADADSDAEDVQATGDERRGVRGEEEGEKEGEGEGDEASGAVTKGISSETLTDIRCNGESFHDCLTSSVCGDLIGPAEAIDRSEEGGASSGGVGEHRALAATGEGSGEVDTEAAVANGCDNDTSSGNDSPTCSETISETCKNEEETAVSLPIGGASSSAADGGAICQSENVQERGSLFCFSSQNASKRNDSSSSQPSASQQQQPETATMSLCSDLTPNSSCPERPQAVTSDNSADASGFLDAAAQRSLNLLADGAANMSTSTTDISDSRIQPGYRKRGVRRWQGPGGVVTPGVGGSQWNPPLNRARRQALEDALGGLAVEGGADGGEGAAAEGWLAGPPSSQSSGSASDTEGSASMPYRTPCSSSPATPGTDMKSCPWQQRHMSGLSRHLDCDGLTSHLDPVQRRLAQIEAEYQRRIVRLEQRLRETKQVVAMYQMASGRPAGRNGADGRDDTLSTESAESGEHTPAGGCSAAASDVSWEQLEEDEAEMTLWVPDHAVTHCEGCHNEFWVVRRKHHCRNCGKVFCNECTNFYIPIPEQYLNNPVRVCSRCHQSLRVDCGQAASLLLASSVNGACADIRDRDGMVASG